MTTLIAALVLAQATPAGLTLPYEKATPVNDEAVGALPAMNHWEARGRVVADDGSTIFDGEGAICWLPSNWTYIMKERLVFPTWKTDQLPLTPGQREAFSQATEGFNLKKNLFQAADVMEVVSATDRAHVVLRHTFGEGGMGVSLVALESGKPSDNKVYCAPKKGESPGRPIADVASDAMFVPYVADKKGEYRLVNGPKPQSFAYREGYIPFSFDSAHGFILGFTYSEHGGQDMLMLHPLNGDTDIRIPRPKEINAEIGVSALLPDGTILTTYKRHNYDDESPDSQFGIYQCAPPYSEVKYLGPYQIQGSSRNGKYLLISHQTLRKSWLIQLK